MLLELVIAALAVAIVYLVYRNLEWKMKFEHKVKEWVAGEEKRIREDAIMRSSRVVSGKTLEKLVPFLDRFSYDPHDIRWLGDPIDFVIFDGLSSKELKQVVFCEVKSGKSATSSTQNKIKDLVEDKKVKWYEFKI
ncbi:MAG: hypothetical protein HYW24_00960 [Candidatus Aenigmarchaeota archaeon]|nr:hypothetical protein [Candidatus Aenigmarchaeota archaeon]